MEIMVWLKFLRNVHFVVLQAFIEGLEGWLSLSKMQTDFRSSKSKSSEKFFNRTFLCTLFYRDIKSGKS
jgi:hypothetical protein